ncbi:hypothetical protein CCZ27_09420 [Thauera sinica]|nr:hypothetical protein CCZ27_09420 [Thauera sp. K11]
MDAKAKILDKIKKCMALSKSASVQDGTVIINSTIARGDRIRFRNAHTDGVRTLLHPVAGVRPLQTTADPFVREPRYIVIKLSDLDAYAPAETRQQILQAQQTIDTLRVRDGRPPLECVVVERDWPEYADTWAAIEQRTRRMQSRDASVMESYGAVTQGG